MTGNEVRKRRKAAGLSMENLATAARVSWATVQRVETRRPRTELVSKGHDPDKVARIIAALEAAEGNGAHG